MTQRQGLVSCLEDRPRAVISLTPGPGMAPDGISNIPIRALQRAMTRASPPTPPVMSSFSGASVLERAPLLCSETPGHGTVAIGPGSTHARVLSLGWRLRWHMTTISARPCCMGGLIRSSIPAIRPRSGPGMARAGSSKLSIPTPTFSEPLPSRSIQFRGASSCLEAFALESFQRRGPLTAPGGYGYHRRSVRRDDAMLLSSSSPLGRGSSSGAPHTWVALSVTRGAGTQVVGPSCIHRSVRQAEPDRR
jgi:hypothetical protein